MQSLESLHAELLAGDLRASSRIVELALPVMLRLIEKQVPELQAGGHEEACMDVLFGYLAAPANYQPQKSSLLTWLTMKARYGAKTMVRAQNRRIHYEQAAADVQLLETHEIGGEDDALTAIELDRVIAAHWRDICETAEEEEVFLLEAAGEHRTATYLEALGLLATPENHSRIAATRERLRGRVRRLKPRLEPEGEY